MSIASEINRIKANIANAYTEAEAKGATMPATKNSDNLADTVASIPTGSTPTLQSKTVTPTTSQQSVTPDSGYDGLSDVTVNATPLEVKTITPTSQQQVVTPTAPNIGLSSVTVEAPSEALKNINLDAYIQGNLTDIVTAATYIRNNAFSSTDITRISFPNVIEIGSYAFTKCSSLTNLIFPEGLLKIGGKAFQSCIGLVSVDMSFLSQIPTLGDNAFYNTTCPFLFRDQTQLDAYAAATNWSALASRFQIKPSGV